MFAYKDFIDNSLSKTRTSFYLQSRNENYRSPVFSQTHPVNHKLINIRIQKLENFTKKRSPRLPRVLHRRRQSLELNLSHIKQSELSPQTQSTPLSSQGQRSQTAGSRLNRSYQPYVSVLNDILKHITQYIPIIDRKRHPKDSFIPNAISPRHMQPISVAPFSPSPSRKRQSGNQKQSLLTVQGLKVSLDSLSEQAMILDMEGNQLQSIQRAFKKTIDKYYSQLYSEYDSSLYGVSYQNLAKQLKMGNPRLRSRLIQLMQQVSDQPKQAFLALGGVYEYSNPGKSYQFSLTNHLLIRQLQSQIKDLKEIYSVYAQEEVVKKSQLLELCKNQFNAKVAATVAEID